MKFANNSKLGLCIVFFLSFVPVAFWLPYANFSNLIGALKSIGQVTALLGAVLFCLNFILATRWRFLEHIFFGLNRVYIAHHLVGAIGFVLLIIHPLSLFLSYLLISPKAALTFITPSAENTAILAGSLALITMSVLLVLTLFIRPEYDRWKKTHQLLGLSLLLASLHGFQIGSTLSQSIVLRIYIYGFFILAMLAFVYRFIEKIRRGNKYRYIVENVVIKSGITNLYLKPTSEAMKFIPGQFAFIQINQLGILRQSHPFSMTSSPSEKEISFAAKSLGDYTKRLPQVNKGTEVLVEGPYGRFSYIYHKNSKQVWIGGGIGITPFISMIKSLPKDTSYSIVLYYLGRDTQEATFIDEVKNIVSEKKNITYVLWLSKEKGRITVEQMMTENPDMLDRDILLCTPPAMLKSFKSQFGQVGFPSSQIHTEEFELA